MTAPTIDFESIMDALALRFVAAQIGTPSGATAMKASYAEPPKSVPQTPAHLLEVQDGTLELLSPGFRHEMNVDGLLLLAKRPADPVRVEEQRQRWLPYLLHATADQSKLGIGAQAGYEVLKVIPVGWEWDTYKVAEVEFEAIRVHWTIFISETVVLVPA